MGSAKRFPGACFALDGIPELTPPTLPELRNAGRRGGVAEHQRVGETGDRQLGIGPPSCLATKAFPPQCPLIASQRADQACTFHAVDESVV
jgi:hypothetical protein